ncbi:Bromodomain adjacent to zinc finger domain protein 1A [Clonorchis sinensis]|uniref:Bromodomain adjacent to zinc finger domain protein 1A n=1 Tax=Clonorchis sinensis TaxID=79923 RepID=A0A8T1LZ44_CLOSI|nr:Bromodomain adjacent to zinc finger domain protein 1A [Clonorchis sinensis]
MPCIDGKPFHRQLPPVDLDPNESVFFSPITLEIFRNYDEYFDRTVLVSSLVWHCQVCDRGQMTFVDAVSCERSHLSTFNPSLSAGLLYIIHSSKRRRLGELVELLSAFANHRYFIGEPVWNCMLGYRKRTPATIRRVLWAASLPDAGLGLDRKLSMLQFEIDDYLNEINMETENEKMFSPRGLVYHVVDDKCSGVPYRHQFRPRTILSFTRLERRNRDLLTRDRIKTFIRHTCELKNGFFSPKVCVMRQFSLSPYGPVTWADLFLPPEPNWEEVVKRLPIIMDIDKPPSWKWTQAGTMSNVDCSQRSVTHNQPGSNRSARASPHTRKQMLGSRNFRFVSDSGSFPTAPSGSPDPSTFDPRSNRFTEHWERLELEREWGAVRLCEDLDLSDLVPLPDFPEFKSSIAPEDIGSAIQLFEFLNAFGVHLDLFLPNETPPDCRWISASSGAEQDSTTSSYLPWSTLVSSLTESDPTGPLADLFISLLCAIRKLDVDASAKQMGPTVLAATYAAAAAVAAAEAGVNFSSFTIGHASDYEEVYEELISGDDGKEVLRVLGEAGAATRLNELVGIPSLASNQAAGKAGMVIRNLEDLTMDNSVASKEDQQAPVTLSRNSTARAATMAILAGATSLCPLDRAGLSKALWLHIKSSPARISSWRGQTRGIMRPLDDPAFILARNSPELLDKLNTVSVYELTVREKLQLLSCLIDQLLLYSYTRDRFEHSFNRLRVLRSQLRSVDTMDETEPEQTAGTSKPGQTSSKAKPENSDDDNRSSSVRERTKNVYCNRPSSRGGDSEISRSKSSHTSAENVLSDMPCTTVQTSVKSNLLVLDSPDADLLQSVKTLRALMEASRGCCLLPLGQDRFYRYYWYVPSLSSILIEDAPLSCGQDELKMARRQFSSFFPEVAERLGLCSFTSAALKLRECVKRWSTGKLPISDREKLTNRLASRIPKDVVLDISQLRLLVRPGRLLESDVARQNSGPAVVQLSNLLRTRMNKADCNQVRWSIVSLLPGPPPESVHSEKVVSLGNSAPHIQSSSCPGETKSDNGLHASEPADVSIKPEECSTQATQLGGHQQFVENGTVEPRTDYVASSAQFPGTLDLWNQAVWTLDCLEASLNPRGLREAHLRKTIGELRPLLIRLLAGNTFTKPMEKGLCKTTTQISTQYSPESVQLSWLEISLRRLAARLRLCTVINSCLAMGCVRETDQLNETHTDSHLRENVLTVEASSSASVKHEELRHKNFQPITDSLETSARLRKLAQLLLALGHAVGPKAVSGPISQENRTLRTGRYSLPFGEITASGDSIIVSQSCSGQLPLRTTGWQRWCTQVEQVNSSSELHLLARALERGVRRAAIGGRRIPFASSTKKRSLPKIRCTACRWPPDPQPTTPQFVSYPAAHSIHFGPHTPLSTCAGCSAPFHLDCLLNSRSRVHRSSLRSQSNKLRPPSAVELKGLTESDLRMTGYCGFHSSLNSITAARMETCGASVYLCNACLRVAGKKPQCDLTPHQYDNSSHDQLTGDEEWETDSEVSNSEVEEFQPATEIKVPVMDDLLADGHRRRGRPAKLGSPAEQPKLCIEPRRRHSTPPCRLKTIRPASTTTVRASQLLRVGRPHTHRILKRTHPNRCSERHLRSSAKRIKLSVGEDRYTKRPIRPNRRYFELDFFNPSMSELRVEQSNDGDPTDDLSADKLNCGWDEESILKFPDIFLKRATVVVVPCDLNQNQLPMRRPSLRRSSKPESTSSSAVNGFPEKTDTQKWVEKLFSDLCHSNSARPLLRCGVGRQITLLDQKDRRVSELPNSRRHSDRVRVASHRLCPTDSPQTVKSSEKLLAWDLSSLQELLIRQDLPGGPEQAVDQLKLLISHWLTSNRPGSRLHQCALDLSDQLDVKLSAFKQQSEPSPSNASSGSKIPHI